MKYLCKKCGNKNSFHFNCNIKNLVTEFSTGTKYINQEGEETDLEYHDTYDRNYEDTETFEEENVVCDDCYNDVELVKEEEWEAWKEGLSEEQQKPASDKLKKIKEVLLK